MKERIGAQVPELRNCNEVFACRLPGSDIQKVTFSALPAQIRKDIGRITDCGLALQIIHQDLTTTFVGENSAFETLHFQDRNDKNRYLGEGQVHIQNIEDELYIPVVGFTKTSNNFLKKGFGTRRLIIMDAVTRVLYDEPLYSSTTPKFKQRSLWEHLVEDERAEVFEFNGVKRYKFI